MKKNEDTCNTRLAATNGASQYGRVLML